MRQTVLTLTILVALLVVTPAAFGQFTNPATTNVTVTVGPEAALSVSATTPLTTGTTLFDDYTGTTLFSYKIRTTRVGGSGSITAQVTTDFSTGSGPSVAAPPSAGDALQYVATLAGPATAASGTLTASTTATTGVGTFSANARSAKAGNSGSLVWSLTNDPRYETGEYTATVTFSISAL
jgi:hypothetical protein